MRTDPDGDTIRRSVNRDFYRQSLVNGCSTKFNDTILDSHTYAYNAANRLASVSSNGVVLVANEYDYHGRRIKKTTPTTETTFVYDGWNLVYEREVADDVTNETFYCWGNDLSGTLQGAGGVGGLLYLKRNGTIYVPHADAYGNILRYTDTAGNVVAEYTYDALGKIAAQSGPLANIFRHRFSTKYYDSETGLYYYGYRFYSPTLMRWLNRDPIEEEGGLNLYGFCGNDTMSKYDFLGMETSIDDWELIGEISEAHSWNCIEWKSMSKDWKTRRKSSRGEVGEGVKDGGTQKNYVRHFKEITFKLDIHVPERCVNPFSYGIVSVLGMSNDPKSYWCLSYAPLRIYKKCINRKMKYLLKITIRNLDRHPRFSNTPEIHHPDKEGKTFEYGPI